MTWGKLYWPFYLIVASLLFLGPELIALFTNVQNTLSDYARYELNVSAQVTVHTIAWYVSLIGWALFVVVISLHIWGDWG